MKECITWKVTKEALGPEQEANDLSLWSSYCGPLHAVESCSKPTPICALGRNDFNASCKPKIYTDLHSYDLLYLEEVNEPPQMWSQHVFYLLPSKSLKYPYNMSTIDTLSVGQCVPAITNLVSVRFWMLLNTGCCRLKNSVCLLGTHTTNLCACFQVLCPWFLYFYIC